jgi:hypothetical protein
MAIVNADTHLSAVIMHPEERGVLALVPGYGTMQSLQMCKHFCPRLGPMGEFVFFI